MEDEDICKTMPTIHIPKYMALIFMVTFMFSSCTNEYTFVVTDIVFPDNISENNVQKEKERSIGAKVNLLFSDKDVRMTANLNNGKTQSMILKEVGNDLYRGEGGGNILELELNKTLGYIKSCKVAVYDKEGGSSMVWIGTMILKRMSNKKAQKLKQEQMFLSDSKNQNLGQINIDSFKQEIVKAVLDSIKELSQIQGYGDTVQAESGISEPAPKIEDFNLEEIIDL